MHVAALWRYPVKSLAGERLQQAVVTTDGLYGDRLVHVRGPRGPLTGRTRPGLLTLPASTGADGVPRVAGHPRDTVRA
ncbi:MOSC N-terminal beta barrel domain-containing protein, partial [Actinoplanes utahensis]|uniref:MOSC N-terminal beta barrel domain-containing protein n=1 Tax=Actinoplanes utahensis TaxID=1869 RepID=UPI0031EDB3EE